MCSVKFINRRRIQTDIMLTVHFFLCSYCKCLIKHELLYNFCKVLKYQFSFHLSSGSQRAAMTNPVVTFLKFVKAPNIVHFATHLKYSKTRTYILLNPMGRT